MLSLENLRTVFGKCPETCLVMYPDAPRFTIAYANANYLEATNRTAVDIVGKGIFEAFPGTQVDLHKDSDIKTSLEQVLEHKSVHKSSLFRFNLPDQASSTNEPHFWISETYPLINDCGSIEYIVRSVQDVTQFVSAKDITTISKAEQQIEAHHQRIANILESVTDGFLALDRNFTVTYWNKEAERILCKSREEAMGENLWSLYPEAVHKKFYSEYHKALSENVSRQFQEYLDVVQCWLEVTAYPSEDGLSIFFKDISDRIAAEEQLKEANEQYQNLFDLSPAPNWVYDVETLAILDVNKASLDHYGYSKEEFLRMTLTDVRPTEDLTEFMNVINKEVKPFMVSGGSSDHIKLGRHKKKSGEIINVEVKGSNISFQGRVARLALIIDVTERMRSAHELSVSEQRFRALVQEGSDLIQIIDEHGFYKYVSPNAHRVLKRVFKVGDKAFASVVEPDKQDVLHALNKLQNGECTKLPRVRCRDMNNEIQWMEITLTNLMDDPAVNGIVSNSRNVTEQINSELKIKKSVEQYDIVSEATSDAIYEWNLNAKYLKWNKGFEILFGHDTSSSEDVERWFKMLHPEDKDAIIAHMHAMFLAREPKVTMEYRFRCADGSYKHVLDRCYLIYDDTGEPMRIIGAMQDVTDRINYIKSLEEKNKKLSEISWLQSHVVRAPLAQIMGMSELLSVDESDEERKQLLSHLKNSAIELDLVIRGIIKKTENI